MFDRKQYDKEYHKRYYALNRERKKQYRKHYRETNREAHRCTRNAEYHKNKDKILKQRADYYTRYHEQVRQRVKQWRKDNPELCRKADASRRAAKLQATPIWYDKEYDDFVFEEMVSQCVLLEQETGVKYHIDHIVPLRGKNVCGLHYHKNWQILSASENLGKNNRHE